MSVISVTFPRMYLTWRRYLRFRDKSLMHAGCLGAVEFVLGVWFVYTCITPVIYR